MSHIIKKKVKNTIYIYEEISYRDENGKVKHKQNILDKLDANGDLIPSKKAAARAATQAQDIQSPQTTLPQAQPQGQQQAEEVQGEVTKTAAIAVIDALKVSVDTSETQDTPSIAMYGNNESNENNLLTLEIQEIPIVPEIVEESSMHLETINQGEYPKTTAIKADQYKFPLTKLDQLLFNLNKNERMYNATGKKDVKVNVSKGNSQKKRIETLLYIDFNNAKENGIIISYEDRITPYDREVYNAVATLVAAGNGRITPSMIFQLLSGNSLEERNKMSPETREKIIRSVEKMSLTRIIVDASAEVKSGMIAQAIFTNYLIPAKMEEFKINGQVVRDGIVLLDKLPLFDYANKKKQVASIDVKLLDTPLANTPENIVLKGYLLRRIVSISNAKNNMSDTIRYDTLYSHLKIQAPNRNALKIKYKQIRDKTKRFLEFWKMEGFIKDYREEKEVRTLAKIIVDF